MYPWDSEEGGFSQQMGDMEFVSDYWWTGDYDWDSEYGEWGDYDWESAEYDWSEWGEYDDSWLQPMPSVEFEGELETLENDLEGINPETDWSFLQKQSDFMVDELLTTVPQPPAAT